MAERGRENLIINQDMPAPSRTYVPRQLEMMSEVQRTQNDIKRLQDAELSAQDRNCILTPELCQLLVSQESFFHANQQSAEMVLDFQRRTLHSYETMREASIKKQTEENRHPMKVPPVEVNPTKITLSLEIEDQFYEQMMNQENDNVENFSSIMFKTNTLIQLPDRHLCNQPNPFVQQVAINGFYKDVENARWLIRENCPLVVYVSLLGSQVDIPHFVATLQAKSVTFERVKVEYWEENRERKFEYPCLRLSSFQKNEKYMLQACESISNFIFNGSPPENAFTIFMDLSTFHIDHIIGIHGNGKHEDALLMPKIQQRTNTRITYPEMRSSIDLQRSIMPLRIDGNCFGVLQARRFVADLLPVSMCFNINNNDMRVPATDDDRIVEFNADETTMVTVKFVKSISEPKQLLEGEESQHLASIRSREFLMAKVYDAYRQLLSPKLKVEKLIPNDNGSSMWYEVQIPNRLRKFEIPCRGDPPANKKPVRKERDRTVSASSIQAETRTVLHRSSSRVAKEQPGRSSNRHSSASSVTETETVQGSSTFHAPQAFNHQQVMMHQQMGQPVPIAYDPRFSASFKPIGTVQQHHQIGPLIFSPYFVLCHQNVDMTLGQQPIPPEASPNYMIYHGSNIDGAKAVQGMRHPEAGAGTHGVHNKHNIPIPNYGRTSHDLSMGSRSRPQSDLDPGRSRELSQKVGSGGLGNMRIDRNIDNVRMDDERNSINSNSRRTSINEDDYSVNNDARQARVSHRSEPRMQSRNQSTDIHKNKQSEITMLPRSTDLHHNKRGHAYPKNLSHRGSSTYRSDLECRNIIPTSLLGLCDQQQFSGVHTLKLRSDGNMSVDNDQLFTQDNSTIVDDRCSSRLQYSQQPSLNASFEAGFSAHDELPSRYSIDNERAYHHQDNVYLDSKNEKKTTSSPNVSKTLLEAKSRSDKPFQKTHLETKKRERNHTISNHDVTELPVGTSVNPIDLIRIAGEETKAGTKPGFELSKERTFADVLKDKDRKLPLTEEQVNLPSEYFKTASAVSSPTANHSEGDKMILLNREEVIEAMPKSQSAPSKLMI